MKKNYTSWKDRYNEMYGYKKNESHTLDEISKDTGVSLKGLQQIYNKGIGAYKTNPSSVRPSVKSKEQWAMARVYSAVMGGKTARIDANELKMELGGGLNDKLMVQNHILNRHPKKEDIFIGGKVDGYKVVKIVKIKKKYGTTYELYLINTKKNKEGGYNKRIVSYSPDSKTIGDFKQGFLSTTKGKFYIEWSDIRFEGGGQTEKQQNKIRKVMGEYKRGDLKTSTGKKVTDREQAIAIALSEAGVRQKMANGGLFGIFPDLTERERRQIADAYVQKMAEGGEITQLEVDAMTNYINSPNANPILSNSYKKVLSKFGVDVESGKPSRKIVKGEYIDPYNFSGYEYMRSKNEEVGVSYLLTGEYELVSKAIYEKDYSMWLFYNYLGRINISFKACADWLAEAQDYFAYEMPIPIYLVHTPNAKDGRSYAMWYGVPESRVAEAQSRIGRPITWSYDGQYFYNEIGMVGNFDFQGGGWGTLYKERKTGLLIPEFTETSFHFNTLIHEFAHCLDFQSQLMANISKYEGKLSKAKEDNVSLNTEEMSELEKELYGNSLNKKPDTLARPITNHFDYFVDSLIKILRASASGKIPLTQVYEQQALDVQTALSGVYGDLLLEQRERKRKQEELTKREDEARENTRFTWQSKWVEDIRDYVYQKAKLTDLKEKVSKNNKSRPFTLTEAIEFDNLINSYMEDVFKPYIIRYPAKAQGLLDGIRGMKAETNRIINNHYDNIRNKFMYGFEPKTDLELYLLGNCNVKTFSDYKSWKECAKNTLQSKS